MDASSAGADVRAVRDVDDQQNAALSEDLTYVAGQSGSIIDARDIVAVAARLLASREPDNRDFDLPSPEPLDHDQVTAILSRDSTRQRTTALGVQALAKIHAQLRCVRRQP